MQGSNKHSTIKGIPCIISVTYCKHYSGSLNAPSDLDYYGFTEIEFDVLDRKGYKAPWLERKLTDDEIERIEREIVSYMN